MKKIKLFLLGTCYFWMPLIASEIVNLFIEFITKFL